jgi:Protein of unknown function (DUF3800)
MPGLGLLQAVASILNVYADESSQDQHRYMVLSGIAVEAVDLARCKQILKAVQERHQTFGTMKWVKVSKTKLPVYVDYCDAFFEQLNKTDMAHFHSMTVDTTQVNNAYFNLGSREIGFSKMIYQLLMKFGRKYGRNHHLHCYLDDRTTRQSLEEIREMLNHGLKKRWGIDTQPVRRLQFAQTESEPLLQINDVLLGALAHRCNDHHKVPGAAAHKCTLSAHVLKRASITNPLSSTASAEVRFTTWMFRLQDGRRV